MNKDDEESFLYLINDITRLMKRLFDYDAKQYGLTRSQWWTIVNLYRTEGITQTELAEALDMERAGVGSLIDKLETERWVSRKADPKDRRVKRIHLGEQANNVIDELRQRRDELQERSMGGVSQAKYHTMIQALIMIKGNLETMSIEESE